MANQKKSFQIAPSLLAADLANLGTVCRELEAAGADVLHLDIMDGHFVPNITFGLPLIESIRPHTKLPFDAHLMISNADSYIADFAKAGCNWLSVHVEACAHLHRTLGFIREQGVKAGVAINPGTALFALDSVLDHLDFVLVMSVNPGFGGQKFIPQTCDRIGELKKKIAGRPILIEVDGGIKDHNIADVVRAGADVIVVGTGLFAQKDLKASVRHLRESGAK